MVFVTCLHSFKTPESSQSFYLRVEGFLQSKPLVVHAALRLCKLVVLVAPPPTLLGTAGLYDVVDVVQRGLVSRHLHQTLLRRYRLEREKKSQVRCTTEKNCNQLPGSRRVLALNDLAVSEEQRQTSGGGAVLQAAATLLQTGVGSFQPSLQLQERLLLA